jgi:hypothetical protein
MRSAIDFTDANYQKIKQLRLKNEEQYKPKIIYYKMEIDTSKRCHSPFGYEAGYKKSDVTTGNRLFYDRTKPYKRHSIQQRFKSVKEIIIPKHIIPKEFWPVIDLLKSNTISCSQKMTPLLKLKLQK